MEPKTTIVDIKECVDKSGWIYYKYYIDGVLSMEKNPMTHHKSGRLVK